MSRSDLKDLGEMLDAGQAGLIAVYETNLADQVAANIKAANRVDLPGDRHGRRPARGDIQQAETERKQAAVPQQAARSPDAAGTMTATGG